MNLKDHNFKFIIEQHNIMKLKIIFSWPLSYVGAFILTKFQVNSFYQLAKWLLPQQNLRIAYNFISLIVAHFEALWQ